MSTTTPLHDSVEPNTLKVTQLRVLSSEWTKFWSVRSTFWTLATAVGLTVGLGALLSAVTASQYENFSEADIATFDAASTSLGGTMFSQLAIGVLGVLLITGEYSTGMIRSSLTVVPRRLPMLWAKLGVFAGVAFVVSLAASFVAFYVGQLLLSSKDLDVSIGSDGALRAVVGSAFYVMVAGLIAIAIGALLRNTAAAITTFVGVFFVFPPLTLLLPGSWSDTLVQYLPSNAGASIYSPSDTADALSPGAGLVVLLAYVVVLVGAAAWRLERSDA